MVGVCSDPRALHSLVYLVSRLQKRNDSFRSRSSLRYMLHHPICFLGARVLRYHVWIADFLAPLLIFLLPAFFYRLIKEQSCSLVSETSTCRGRGLRWRADLPNVLYVVSYSDLRRIKEHLRNPASEVIKSDESTQRIVRPTVVTLMTTDVMNTLQV